MRYCLFELIRNPLILTFLFFSSNINPFTETANAEPVKFNRDIRPILADNCWSCHGPDKGNRKAKIKTRYQ